MIRFFVINNIKIRVSLPFFIFASKNLLIDKKITVSLGSEGKKIVDQVDSFVHC